MHIVVRTRRALAVHPWIHWAVCVGLAVAAAVATHGYIARLDAERRAWGTTREVWVAVGDVAAGQAVRASTTEVPVALVPPGAVTEPPDDAVARQRVTAGRSSSMPISPRRPARLRSPDPTPSSSDWSTRWPATSAIGLDVQIAAEGVVLRRRRARSSALSDDVILVAVAARDGPIVASAAHDGLASVLFLP